MCDFLIFRANSGHNKCRDSSSHPFCTFVMYINDDFLCIDGSVMAVLHREQLCMLTIAQTFHWREKRKKC